ncbi:amidohydrolase family protein [Pseudochelatococcus sp. B33]
MTLRPIDCDVHPMLPGMKALLPYLEPYWQDQVTTRGMDAFDITTYPPKYDITVRPDWRLKEDGTGQRFKMLRDQVLGRFNASAAICNVVYGGQIVFNVYLAAAICRAINDWIVAEWLELDDRLRASIVIPVQDTEMAIEEIERRADDPRFVQILFLSGGDTPLGQRRYWPIYRVAEKYGLPIGIHAGHAHRFAPTYTGWPSFYLEDHATLSHAIQGQLLSLVYEGVFAKFPDLRVVLMESGVSWLPSFMWRADNTWRALRSEVPWVEQPPSSIVRERVRLTMQPLDVPANGTVITALFEQIGSEDMLLYASDFPHWQFDGDAVFAPGISDALKHKIAIENPLATYDRLRGVQ